MTSEQSRIRQINERVIVNLQMLNVDAGALQGHVTWRLELRGNRRGNAEISWWPLKTLKMRANFKHGAMRH
jgi:hypothetical protein